MKTTNHQFSNQATYDRVCERIMRLHGIKTLSDQVNLSLACGKMGLDCLVDHVSISMDYLSIDEQTVFSIGIMDRVYDGIVSISFEE